MDMDIYSHIRNSSQKLFGHQNEKKKYKNLIKVWIDFQLYGTNWNETMN